jgi:hypothetical protein
MQRQKGYRYAWPKLENDFGFKSPSFLAARTIEVRDAKAKGWDVGGNFFPMKMSALKDDPHCE